MNERESVIASLAAILFRRVRPAGRLVKFWLTQKHKRNDFSSFFSCIYNYTTVTLINRMRILLLQIVLLQGFFNLFCFLFSCFMFHFIIFFLQRTEFVFYNLSNFNFKKRKLKCSGYV